MGKNLKNELRKEVFLTRLVKIVLPPSVLGRENSNICEISNFSVPKQTVKVQFSLDVLGKLLFLVDFLNSFPHNHDNRSKSRKFNGVFFHFWLKWFLIDDFEPKLVFLVILFFITLFEGYKIIENWRRENNYLN